MFCPHSRGRFLMCCNVFDPSASRMFIKKTLCLFSAGTAEPEVKKKIVAISWTQFLVSPMLKVILQPTVLVRGLLQEVTCH